jgi:hypothetical protein
MKKYVALIALAGGLAFAPVAAMASQTGENPNARARQLFQRIENDAKGAEYHAYRAHNDAMNEMIDWQVHGMYLADVRGDIRDMDKAISRLQTLQGMTPGEQQKTSQAEVLIHDLSVNADGAIRFLKNNRHTLWQPEYRTYTENVYKEARDLAQTMKRPVG